MNDPEILPPPQWISPILDRLDDLAASGDILCTSRDACECLLHWLGLEDVPTPILAGIERKQAFLGWITQHHKIIVLPYWPRFGTLACQIAVYVDGRLRVNKPRAEPLETLRSWLAEAYEDVGARLDVGEPDDDDVNRLMVAMIQEVGRKTTFDGDEYYVVGGYVYRVLGEAAYEEVGVSR